MRTKLLVPSICVLVGAMLVVQAVAGNASRAAHPGAEAAYWFSYLVVVLSALAAQLLGQPTPRERLALVIAAGLGLYMIKVLSYPNSFTYFDELSHYRTTADVLRFGRLFHANPALAVSPFFPGLEVVTSALVRLTGLSITTAGLLVIGIGRVVLAAGLYGLFSEASRSRRVGGLAAILYMANPSFLYFDSDFSYESFALPLASVSLLLAFKWMRASPGQHRSVLAVGAVVAAGGVVATHHTTSYLLAIFLCLLVVCALWARRLGGTYAVPYRITASTLALAALWLSIIAPSTAAYLGGVFGPAIDGAKQVLLYGGARVPFSGGTAVGGSPLWLQLTAFGSVLLVAGSLPLGVALVWRRRFDAPVLAMGAVAVTYPAVQLLRLSGAGVESANRSSEFVFVGAAFLLALSVVHLTDSLSVPYAISVRGRRILGRRRLAAYLTQPLLVVAIIAAGAVLFVGGVVSLWPPYARLPGRYLAGSDVRSITPQSVAAAQWIESHYGRGQRVLTDRSDEQIVAAYGAATPVIGSVGPSSVMHVFISPRFDPLDRHIIRGAHVGFLLVDARFSRELPARGFYFDSLELGGGSWTEPIPLAYLTKFARVPGISLAFDNGPIQVYDVRSLR